MPSMYWCVYVCLSNDNITTLCWEVVFHSIIVWKNCCISPPSASVRQYMCVTNTYVCHTCIGHAGECKTTGNAIQLNVTLLTSMPPPYKYPDTFLSTFLPLDLVNEKNRRILCVAKMVCLKAPTGREKVNPIAVIVVLSNDFTWFFDICSSVCHWCGLINCHCQMAFQCGLRSFRDTKVEVLLKANDMDCSWVGGYIAKCVNYTIWK